jgi:LAO/AO transport system kinase
MELQHLISKMQSGDRRALSRCISLVENSTSDALEILKQIHIRSDVPVIGITGPPGAGKSTLANALIASLKEFKPGCRIAVLAVDPTSPFTQGAILGDRVRMSDHFNDPDVYIRSLATRGVLGGLSARTLEITDVLKSAGFDFILVETVGVGQSEIEIAALADVTLVVLVPEAGDEIQTLKSGVMEIADIFVVNKADREGADIFEKNLRNMLHEKPGTSKAVPVFATIATRHEGLKELLAAVADYFHPEKIQKDLLRQRALQILMHQLWNSVDTAPFLKQFEQARQQPGFNLYRFADQWLKTRGGV